MTYKRLKLCEQLVNKCIQFRITAAFLVQQAVRNNLLQVPALAADSSVRNC
jgi:hypothetical protein